MADRSVLVRLRADISQYQRSLATAGTSTKAFVKDLDSADSRMANLVQTALALAPALVPIGGAGVTAVAGLATQLGFAASAAGVGVLAFHGVGDALEALNKYQLEPTDANLAALRDKMRGLGPAAQEFVSFLDKIGPKLQKLREEAQEGLLPGVQEGIEEWMVLMPRWRKLVGEIADTTGDLFAEAGDNLNDPRWRAFFKYLQAEARPALTNLGKSIGNVVDGLAHLLMGLDPLTDQFSRGLLNVSRDFAEWANNLDDNESFQSFVEDVERMGPKAVDTLGGLVQMLGAFVAAAAPVGEATLPIIKAVAGILENIAESPAGSALVFAAAGLSAVSRAVALYNAANGSALARLLGFGGGSTAATEARQLSARAAAVKEVAAATTALSAAEAARARAAASARDAQFALVPTQEKRNAVAAYGAAQRDVAKAEERLAEAEKKRGAAMRATASQVGKSAALVGALSLSMTGLDEQAGLSNTAMLALLGTLAGPWGAAIGATIGLAKDWAAANDNVEQTIRNVDDAIESGSLKAMTKQYDELIARANELANGSSFTAFFAGLSGADKDIERTAERLRAAMDSVRFGTDGATSGLVGPLRDGLGVTKRGLDEVTQSAEELQEELQAVNDLLEGRATMRGYESALDDFAEAFKDSGRTANKAKNDLLIGTEDQRASEAALDGIASSALKVAEDLEGLDKIRFLARARRDFISSAVDLGLTRAAARALADELHLIDGTKAKPEVTLEGAEAAKGQANDLAGVLDKVGRKKPKPNVSVDADQAFSALDRVWTQLNGLRSKTLYVDVVRRGKGPYAADGIADGGTVHGQRHPYGDKVLAMLAPGEEVISNRFGEADRFRADRASGRIPAYAAGGTVDRVVHWEARNSYARTPVDDMALFGRAVADSTRNLQQHTAKVKDDRDAIRDRLRELRSQKSSFQSTVSGSLTHDPFGKGLGSAMLQLQADENDAEAMKAALKQAKKLGLHGEAFKALAGSGDLLTAQDLDTLEEVRQFQAQFDATSKATTAAAAFAGNTAFGPAIKENTEAIRDLRREIRGLDKKLEAATERGSQKGTRSGMDANNRSFRGKG